MIDAPSIPLKSAPWTAEEVIDFEIYLHRDEAARRAEGGENSLGKRDRATYLPELGGVSIRPFVSAGLFFLWRPAGGN